MGRSKKKGRKNEKENDEAKINVERKKKKSFMVKKTI